MLSENEAKILFFLKDLKRTNSIEISTKIGIPESSVLSLIELLREKGYVKTEIISEKYYVLTEEGRKRKENGLPEDILINSLNGQEKDLNEIKNTLDEDFNIAISWAKRKGLIEIKEGKVIPKVKTYTSPEYLALLNLEKADINTINLLKKRGLIEEKERKIVNVKLVKEPKESEIGISNLTREMIVSGEWKKYKLRKYNVEAFPPYYTISKKHYFREFLEKVKDIMISLGFKEINTGYIEMEFYNFDLLFQPQDHPAREIHDSFAVEGLGNIEDKELLSNVKEIHEKFWKYEWKQDITLRLMLRSQTTATTARVLASRPKAPQKLFTLGKVFRPDAIDATHLIEFHQLDGVIIDDNFTFRELLGVLKEIFYRLGIKEIKFKPAYFPFTEPSVEAYGYLEKLGWVEMCGAGLLRPEILSSVGIDSIAGAWGIGIERLAMSFLNISDIRLLYSNNIEYIRDMKVKIE
ncbi:phenylalanyl-tRNA synthetase, alpha subunit [Sulfolobus islandicus Y.G.57.14]|jgi:phenylalanyl-tRNA synthetase alpha chain|uniref:Phenylalanine--tRNA ligase alpha subunit n=4 Tax=Saccharolobus islandicus TaxID=43080 RepID=C3MJ89_SACI2|nr:phenylalanine--tRNA ligase subunit alpha [Sulfolobus islandicus]ACP36176.1 phenylalanyl-tRNA synthetase, alpha subunit [Sulfolobus islandicus L.S.2.15]ACP46399.1 phenylalanyl-tRNA synthetase, alpha subunit [Sulfolobus islandicus Y.G.57.14]ACP47894.1 phenylalanyl-tRNA synthetase, alpha subunit [Sulfolobus islandicus Y.N.15.51]ADB87934.1 phenylalanyl-tRNA synthetase, alpha subunit [Sulfolobus islandicus L.D.8.5]PVU78165.1 phenylalanine--tRNA ligase subunit alpha [Sulfolobus islandicus]